MRLDSSPSGFACWPLQVKVNFWSKILSLPPLTAVIQMESRQKRLDLFSLCSLRYWTTVVNIFEDMPSVKCCQNKHTPHTNAGK